MRALRISPLSGRPLSQQSKTNGETIQCGTQANVDTSGGAVTLLAPVAADWPSAELAAFMVLDASGDASTFPITIDGNGRLIDGEASYEHTIEGGTILFVLDQDANEWRKAILPRRDPVADQPIYLVNDLSGLIPSSSMVGTFAARPVAAREGAIYVPTDGATRSIYDGSEWRNEIPASMLGYAPPLVADGWTLVRANGLGVPTFADKQGTIQFSSAYETASVAEPLRFACRAPPADGASGYRVTAHFIPIAPTDELNSTSLVFGLGCRNSGNGSVELFECLIRSAGGTPSATISGFLRRQFTASNNGATPLFAFFGQWVSEGMWPWPQIWLRFERFTNGDRKYYVSPSGHPDTWRELVAAGSLANSFITPDQILFNCSVVGDPAGSNPRLTGCILDSWKAEAF
jgi:hypothetical protein